jgi:hypothetical protein
MENVMKKICFILILTVLVLACAQAQPAQGAAAEITFTFTRLSGSASNQFAVWIEDSQGQYVKTLYATRYTANGGWKRRETSVPMWVKKSDLASKTQPQIDTLTAATPKTGTLTYRWDGTDKTGAVVPAGDYVITLEGTLRWANQVYYSAPISLGQGASTPEVSVKYEGDAGADTAMIKDVKVRVLR